MRPLGERVSGLSALSWLSCVGDPESIGEGVGPVAGRREFGSDLRTVVGGSTAIMTGASSGIGEATAPMLGANGATTVLVARYTERLEALEQKIQSADRSACPDPAELSDPAPVVIERPRRVAQASGVIGRLMVDATPRPFDGPLRLAYRWSGHSSVARGDDTDDWEPPAFVQGALRRLERLSRRAQL